MIFTEDLAVFFDTEEFGTVAVINGKSVPGIFSYGTVVVNDVETRKPIFTCAEAEVSSVTHDSIVQIQHKRYRIIGIKSDGTGIQRLIIENTAHLAL